MSRYRQQLARIRAARLLTDPTVLRRKVHTGELFDLDPGETVDVGLDIQGAWFPLCTVNGGPYGMKGARVG